VKAELFHFFVDKSLSVFLNVGCSEKYVENIFKNLEALCIDNLRYDFWVAPFSVVSSTKLTDSKIHGSCVLDKSQLEILPLKYGKIQPRI